MSIDKQKSKTIVISSFDNLDKKDLLILIFISTLDKSVINIVIIGADAYCHIAYKLKKGQIFAVFIRDLEFQAAKKARPQTDLKSVVLKEYHDFLDMFLKKY